MHVVLIHNHGYQLITKHCTDNHSCYGYHDGIRNIVNHPIYVGVPCTGMKELNSSGELIDAPKCIGCTHPNPVVYDVMLGEEVKAKNPEDRFKILEEDLEKSIEDRWNAWTKEYDKCIRCYACQRICPACNCRECIFVDQSQKWIERKVDEWRCSLYLQETKHR